MLLNQLDGSHRTNESVMNEIGADTELVAMVRKRKLQYFRQMTRAKNRCTYISEGRLDGARGRGRPRRRWGDDIEDWTGKTLAECKTCICVFTALHGMQRGLNDEISVRLSVCLSVKRVDCDKTCLLYTSDAADE